MLKFSRFSFKWTNTWNMNSISKYFFVSIILYNLFKFLTICIFKGTMYLLLDSKSPVLLMIRICSVSMIMLFVLSPFIKFWYSIGNELLPLIVATIISKLSDWLLNKASVFFILFFIIFLSCVSVKEGRFSKTVYT